MPKIVIGSSVYNNTNNIKNLIYSILAITDYPNEEYAIVVCDDGSSNQMMVDDLERFCRSLGIPLIRNGVNRGVPYSWNRLTEYYDCDYMVILNDDTRVIDKNWLRYITYFFQNNPKAGIVDWRENIIGSNGEFIKSTTSHHGESPRVKLKSSGPFFALRKEIWKQISQPDGSTGFWEDLLAYREEKDIAAEFYQRGFYVFQLPFYMEHFKSQTFQHNPEIRIRKQYSTFLSEDEYFKQYLSYARLNNESYWKNQTSIQKRFVHFLAHLRFSPLKRLNEAPTKLEYSRAMFAKKWEHRMLYNMKGLEYLRNMEENDSKFVNSLEKIQIKYLDSNLQEKEAFI